MVVMKKNKNGFTLVELVVALLMVAFIASALFMFTQSMSRTHVSTTKTEASFTDAMNFADMLQASLAGMDTNGKYSYNGTRTNENGVVETVILQQSIDGIEPSGTAINGIKETANALQWVDRRWVVGGDTVRLIENLCTLTFDANKQQFTLTEKIMWERIVNMQTGTETKGADEGKSHYTRYPDVDSDKNPFRVTAAADSTWTSWKKEDSRTTFLLNGTAIPPLIRKADNAYEWDGEKYDKYIICVPYVVDADNGGGVEVRSIITAAVPTGKRNFSSAD